MSNLFSTSAGREELNSKKSYLPIGIHQDCFVLSAEVVKGEGNPYMSISFIQPVSNSVADKRIYFPDGNAQTRDGETQEEANKRNITNRLAHVTMITDAVLDDKYKDFTAASFEEFVTTAVQRIKQYGMKTPVVIKLVPNSKGYSSFPNYADGVARQVEGKTPLTFSKKELEAIRAMSQEKPSTTLSKEDNELPF